MKYNYFSHTEQIKCIKSLLRLAPGYFSSHSSSGTSEFSYDNSPNAGKIQPACYQIGETDCSLSYYTRNQLVSAESRGFGFPFKLSTLKVRI